MQSPIPTPTPPDPPAQLFEQNITDYDQALLLHLLKIYDVHFYVLDTVEHHVILLKRLENSLDKYEHRALVVILQEKDVIRTSFTRRDIVKLAAKLKHPARNQSEQPSSGLESEKVSTDSQKEENNTANTHDFIDPALFLPNMYEKVEEEVAICESCSSENPLDSFRMRSLMARYGCGIGYCAACTEQMLDVPPDQWNFGG